MYSRRRPPMRFHHILPAPMNLVWTEVWTTQTAHSAKLSGPATAEGHLIAALTVEGTDGRPASDTGPASRGLLSQGGSPACPFEVKWGWTSSRTPPLTVLIGAATPDCEPQASSCRASRSEGARGGFTRVYLTEARQVPRGPRLLEVVRARPLLPSEEGVPVDEWPTAIEIQIRRP